MRYYRERERERENSARAQRCGKTDRKEHAKIQEFSEIDGSRSGQVKERNKQERKKTSIFFKYISEKDEVTKKDIKKDI